MARSHESYRVGCLWQTLVFLQGLVQSLWSSHSAKVVSTSCLSSFLSILEFVDNYAYQKHVCVCARAVVYVYNL